MLTTRDYSMWQLGVKAPTVQVPPSRRKPRVAPPRRSTSSIRRSAALAQSPSAAVRSSRGAKRRRGRGSAAICPAADPSSALRVRGSTIFQQSGRSLSYQTQLLAQHPGVLYPARRGEADCSSGGASRDESGHAAGHRVLERLAQSSRPRLLTQPTMLPIIRTAHVQPESRRTPMLWGLQR